jgi:hypothetical protein
MKTGRRTVLAGMLGALAAGVLPALPARSQTIGGVYLDFGETTPAPAAGYQRVLTTHTVANMTTGRPYGWVSNTGLASRNRNVAATPTPELERDFIFLNTTAARTFRVGNLTPGRYRMTILSGDRTNGDHYTRVTVPGVDGGATLPVLHPGTSQYCTLTATLVVTGTTLDITFDATQTNWVVNVLILEPVTDAEVPRVTIRWSPLPDTLWPATPADPTMSQLADHRMRTAASSSSISSTGLTRAHYLSLISGEIDFWKSKQNANGAIIDPLKNIEFQYSTPAYAHAAATLVAYAGRKEDLLETAALALDWSAKCLATRTAASGHEDFFAPMIAHSIRLLEPFAIPGGVVTPERVAQWKYYIWYFEPYLIYRYGAGVNNWNIVAACGEAMFQSMGIRDASHTFVAASFARQGDNYDSVQGNYLEEAMAYDQFPRLWVDDLLARGYNGAYAAELTEVSRRGAITGLFMQSPTGELSAGGRSAHHQWNEAAECVTFEIYAAKALANGDTELAGIYKRAAHMALQSMRRWIRPSGEMQIIKNWIDPSQQFAYETYSAHSQYNLLPMSMLALAYEHAATTESVAEKPSPADIGGFVVQVEKLDKVFANAAGTYVEIETTGDHHYDATGLIRVHFAGHSAQSAVSDSLLSAPSYVIPTNSQAPFNTGIGISWLGTDSVWRNQGDLIASQITNVLVMPTVTTASSVKFTITYSGSFGGGVTSIVEDYELSQDNFQIKTTLPGFNGLTRRTVPILADDGKVKSKFQQNSEVIKITIPGLDAAGKQTFRFTGASSLTMPATQYANHNGWARLAVAEYPASAAQAGITLRIEAQPLITPIPV